MPTNKGKRNATVHRLPERGVLAVATTTTLPRRSGRGTAPTAPAADVTGTGEAAAADTGTVCAATINAPSSGPSKPIILNSGRNLDIHDAARLPVPSIQDTDNISEYISSEDDSSMYSMTIKKKTTSKKKKQGRKEGQSIIS